ncbi:amino acid adenylation domain-containing protein [Paenibacillus sp. SC116]|uniref:non-ribosomal peptide synthetase n=1 Tax=Paenibacillus sp. SC116 TaxID=2968986 RepID=UPI00215B5C75|nr:amino acid adenylation domain-containing protein [Paenibacillus sp. SC116]MCR8843802.1 amino acid adenylation domain-containing protein [Paenibacillus sp. SC116]
MVEAKQIDRDQVQDVIGLTPLQEGMLFHYVNPQDREHYFEQLCVWLEGDVKGELIQLAWNFVISANEALRSVFRWQQLKAPLQIVLKKWELSIINHDCSHMTAEQREGYLDSLKKADRQQGFDLTEVPFRVILCKESEQRYAMIVSNHHILYDGWSNGILLTEFLDVYERLYRGLPYTPDSKTSNKVYLKYVQSQSKTMQEQYWRSYLAGFDTKSLLPAHHARSVQENSPGVRIFKLTAEQTKEVTQYVRSQKITLAAFVYAAWGVLLQRYTNSMDAVFGTTVSGRTDKVQGMNSMVGLYINTIPCRVTTGESETVSQLLKRMEEMLRDRNDYEATPLVDIHGCSDIDTREGLFESVLVFENYPLNAALQNENRIVRYTGFEMRESTPYEILLSIHPWDELAFELQYAQHKFSSDMIAQFSQHFLNLMQEMMNAPDAKIRDLQLMSSQDIDRLLVECNSTSRLEPIQETVQQRFERQAALSPQRQAVTFGTEHITYEQLNKRANLLAHHLRAKQVGPERVVGLLMNRSVDAIVSMLAVLKAGGAYMPLDPEYPDDRLKYMLEDSRCHLLLTQPQWQETLVGSNIETILLSEFDFSMDDPGNPEPINTLADLAYVIYTSGSTGKPKGVMVEHRNLNSFIYSFIYDLLQPEDRGIWQSSLSFDTSNEEVFPLLLRGGTIIILPKEEVLDTNRFMRCIQEQGITYISCSPHLINQLNGRLTDHRLRLLISGGDELKGSYCSELQGMKLYNSYGPSEATVAVTYFECPSHVEGRVPIGGPIANHYFAVVDKSGRLQPFGAEGELWVAGPSVVRGYMNLPEMTADKFGDSPYFPGERMYKTGDRVRWLPGGQLDFLGRVDHQVKIRGYRIELPEIESVLLDLAEIHEAAVLDIEAGGGHRTLCAYYTGEEQTDSSLRSYLLNRLPSYMVPAYYVHLDRLPLTVNGKLDRRSLPVPTMHRNEVACLAPPSNEIEQQLLHIWQELLPAVTIGVHDHFFEIGGDSILLMRMHTQIDMLYPNSVTITDLFAYTTISKLAQFVGGTSTDKHNDQMEGIELPLSFFNRIPNASPRQIKPFSCNDPIYSKLKLMARTEETEIQHIALGMFMYLLQQMSEHQTVAVQAVINRSDTASPIHLNFNEVEHFSQLFSTVQQLSEQALSSGAYLLQSTSMESREDKQGTTVYPLFAKAGLLSRIPGLTRQYDLILEYRDTGSSIGFHFEYSGRLRQEFIEDLVHGYMQLLADLVEQYELIG